MNHSPSILVFSTQLLRTGGIESHLREFCFHISQCGVSIDLVVLNASIDSETESFYSSHCRRIYLGNKGRSYYRYAWLLLTSLKLRYRRYDALYTNGQGDSVKFFSKLIMRNRTWIHHHHTSGDISDQAKWSKNYLDVLNSANSVIACSKKNAENIQTAIKGKVISVPCFSRQVSDVKMIPGKKLRLGYYGRLIPEKGIDTLCRLSEDLEFEDIEFHIWGEGGSYPASFFLNFSNIQFHGKFSGHSELTNVISSIDAFILLSTHPEGLPISLLEVMSAGTPWLATDQGGISDIAQDPIATRIIPTSSSYSQIKKEILKFILDLKAGRVSRTAQKKLYATKFSPEALKCKWITLLDLPLYKQK